MRINLLSDAHWESRVGKVLDDLSSTGYRALFETRDYGKGLNGITVVFMCQDPSLNLVQRVNFAKKERKLYLDIMLNFDTMKQAAPEVRKQIVVERLAEELPAFLRKYSIKDFDELRFVADFKNWIASVGRE